MLIANHHNSSPLKSNEPEQRATIGSSDDTTSDNLVASPEEATQDTAVGLNMTIGTASSDIHDK